ncbi:GIY-YIG nuclease family protein [Serratia sp. UGAL515B_01]|uniref:GIY-YIG nuclease family protein n=1 Tax=Serratia sp. UGAL515B_01 TaxID=2986763 RepID=UPI002954AFC6|nr:GIY-YIG nuclease family protein [Serratia sp. UGAL515B_01]WON75593.1 GIY-YIG nuclease family protein [Serratia sp. UGAL515B_01]
MSRKSIELNFVWQGEQATNFPKESGVYCVYRTTLNPKKKSDLKELIYIGESENIYERISDHNKLSNWKNCLSHDEVLGYSYSTIKAVDRKRAEAALIYEHQPRCNIQDAVEFHFPETTITLNGVTAHLTTPFTIK